MKETAVQVNERKIRNGIRKQREKIEREQQKVWDKLKDENLGNSTIKRTLRAGWTIEDAVDLKAMHGLDLEEEITKALIANINMGGLDE
ncbi:MAG: hypothetical protein DRQ35_06590 [Gammaproteobacteria bacterium]|nr:MAG: hypothetical protein DRQ35_06590 [Gammaproteobacteria bacterium]